MSKHNEPVDRNFILATDEGREIAYYNVYEAPVDLCGLPWKGIDNSFDRLPAAICAPFNENIKLLAQNTAGAMVRFCTDSDLLAIKLSPKTMHDYNNMSRILAGGFDVYVKTEGEFVFVKSGSGTADETEYSVVFEGLGNGSVREYRINLPLYGGVVSMAVGVSPTAAISAPAPFASKPIGFYGSSITQGGCASRPGNAYTHHLCRWLDAEQINLGFSGNAKGEPEMAELIASLELGAFVLDYDHNAPDSEHLLQTHQPFFNVIRHAHPHLPIVILSRPDFWGSEADRKRRAVILATYQAALDAKDENVYFVDGECFFGSEDRDACTVDGCHPNDLGFYRMAKAIYPVLKAAMGK